MTRYRRQRAFVALALLLAAACGDSTGSAPDISNAPDTTVAEIAAHHQGSVGDITWSAKVRISPAQLCVDLDISRPQEPVIVQSISKGAPSGSSSCSEAPLDTDFRSIGFEPMFLAYVGPAASGRDFVAAGIAAPDIGRLSAATTSDEIIDIDVLETGFFFLASPSDVERLEMTLRDGSQIGCQLRVDGVGLWSLTDCEEGV